MFYHRYNRRKLKKNSLVVKIYFTVTKYRNENEFECETVKIYYEWNNENKIIKKLQKIILSVLITKQKDISVTLGM